MSTHHSELKTNWNNELISKVGKLVNTMVEVYTNVCEKVLGRSSLKANRCGVRYGVPNVWATLKELTPKLIEVVKKGNKIKKTIDPVPEYVNYTNQKLITETNKRLEDMKSVLSENVDGEFERQKFDMYNKAIREKLEEDIVKQVLDEVTNRWLQPWVQNKIEHISISLGEKSINHIFNLFENKLDISAFEMSTRTGSIGSKIEKARKMK